MSLVGIVAGMILVFERGSGDEMRARNSAVDVRRVPKYVRYLPA